MTAYGIGAFSLAVALGLATAMPIWVAVTFIAVAVVCITGMLRAVGLPNREPAAARSSSRPSRGRAAVRPRSVGQPRVLPIPRQRRDGRLARPVE
jgi:hypothetical protein